MLRNESLPGLYADDSRPVLNLRSHQGTGLLPLRPVQRRKGIDRAAEFLLDYGMLGSREAASFNFDHTDPPTGVHEPLCRYLRAEN